MHNIQFVPECFAETELVKVVFGDLGYVNHAEGIHGVSSVLKKDDVATYVNVGFVDNDKKNIPFYFDEFNLIEETSDLIFKKHPDTNDYIFMAKPAIEGFIMAQLREINKQPSYYNLPDDFSQFCKTLKKMRIQYNDGYKRLLEDIKVANTSGISFILSKVTQLQNN